MFGVVFPSLFHHWLRLSLAVRRERVLPESLWAREPNVVGGYALVPAAFVSEPDFAFLDERLLDLETAGICARSKNRFQRFSLVYQSPASCNPFYPALSLLRLRGLARVFWFCRLFITEAGRAISVVCVATEERG